MGPQLCIVDKQSVYDDAQCVVGGVGNDIIIVSIIEKQAHIHMHARMPAKTQAIVHVCAHVCVWYIQIKHTQESYFLLDKVQLS